MNLIFKKLNQLILLFTPLSFQNHFYMDLYDGVHFLNLTIQNPINLIYFITHCTFFGTSNFDKTAHQDMIDR